MDKSLLRRSLLQQRQALSPQDWRDRSAQLSQRLQQLPQFQAAQTLLAYFSFRQEPDLSSLWQNSSGQRWAFPRCVGSELQWHIWQPGDRLVPGAYGILEPSPKAETLDPQRADLMLVPSLGGDRQGHRLGYGGGFYDRCLSHPHLSGLITIGILFEFQFLNRLPADPWDRPLHGFCTEEQVWTVPTSQVS